MAILSILPVKLAQVGVQPNKYKMLTDDNLAAITAVNYLKQYTGGNFYVNNDVIDTIYSVGTLTPVNVSFEVSVSPLTGFITLTAPGLSDLGTVSTKAASNNSNPVVSSVGAGPNIPAIGAVASFPGTHGTMGYVSTNFKVRVITASFGAPNFGVVESACTPESVIIGAFLNTQNPSIIQTIVPRNGNFIVTLSATPGNMTFMYLLLKRQ